MKARLAGLERSVCLGGCAPSRAQGPAAAALPPLANDPPKVGMLFFTQCFGAVLDLIHLRFQHYKAKRVFSAAGQLVCVVNPTHNLKVSCSPRFDVHTAGVQVPSPPEHARSSGPRPVCGRQDRAWDSALTLALCVAGCLRGSLLPPLTGQGSWSEGLVSFPRASAQEFDGGQKWKWRRDYGASRPPSLRCL